MAERSASATWQGDLISGSGEIHESPSGAFGPLQVTWASRTEDDHGGKTSPEELIAGLAYELIRFAGKHTGNRVLMTLLAPGLWLQRLTTREPTLDQIEVSIRALQEVLRLEGAATVESRVEVMA